MTLTRQLRRRASALLCDWTKEGRSKIYGHWGRFYESIPMDINDRSFGGEVTLSRRRSAPSACGADRSDASAVADGTGCLDDDAGRPSEQLIGSSGVLVAPGIKAQYMDEAARRLRVRSSSTTSRSASSCQNRRLGRVIEDVSTDGANTYIIANPGEWSRGRGAASSQQRDRDDDRQARARAGSSTSSRCSRASASSTSRARDYNALEFTLTRRFSKGLYVQGSYTYSRTEGNYPGLVSYDNGQIDPNISSQYDLIELLANRLGPLPQDRPHYVKLDGYYTFDLKKAGALTTGIRFRALSGIPKNALAAHYLYGADESFLLPRGQLGRTDFEHGLDIHVGYGRKLCARTSPPSSSSTSSTSTTARARSDVDETYAPQYSLSAAAAAASSRTRTRSRAARTRI